MVTIRQYLSQDKSQVEHCIAELQNFEIPMEPSRLLGEKMADKYLLHLLEKCSENEGKILVAEVDDKIVGFIAFRKDTFEEYDMTLIKKLNG